MSTASAIEAVNVNGDTEPFQAPVDPTPEQPPVEVTPEVKPLSDDALALAEIREMERECGELEYHAAIDAETAKNSKKRLEAAVLKLRSMIRSRTKEYPLFDKKADESTPETEEGDDSWRDVSIDILSTHGLSNAVVTKLDEDNEIDTIGKLADWTASGKNLTDLAGIGAAKAEAIEKALEGFWAAWGKPVADHVEQLDAEANGEPAAD